MRYYLLLYMLLCTAAIPSMAQDVSLRKTVYVVDSVPARIDMTTNNIMYAANSTDEDNATKKNQHGIFLLDFHGDDDIINEEVADSTIVTNKKIIQKLGYNHKDTIVYISFPVDVFVQ